MISNKNIITLYLERNHVVPHYPFAQTGYLYANGLFIARTLERSDKKIPQGFYHASWCGSPKFKGEKRLLIYNDTDVQPCRGIRVHEGNSVDDTEGCILIGSDMTCLASGEPRLLRSKDAVKLLGTILDNVKPMYEKIIFIVE